MSYIKIDGVRSNGFYHYTLYDDNDSSVRSITTLANGDKEIAFNTGWSLYTKQPDELKDEWVKAVLEYQQKEGISGVIDVLHKAIQDVRDVFDVLNIDFPEHKSLLIPGLGEAMSIIESYENCSDETIEKIMNSGISEIPSPKAIFNHAWKATKYNVTVDATAALYNVALLGVSTVVMPVLDFADEMIDLIFGPVNAIVIEFKRIFNKVISLYKQFQRAAEEDKKSIWRKLVDEIWIIIKTFGIEVWEYLYMILCVDTFIALFNQIKHLWKTKEEIWKSLVAQLKSFIDIDYKSFGSDLINTIADKIFVFLPLLGAMIGAFVAKACAEQAAIEADRELANNISKVYNGKLPNNTSKNASYKDNARRAQKAMAAHSIVYSYAMDESHEFSLYGSSYSGQNIEAVDTNDDIKDSSVFQEKSLVEIYKELVEANNEDINEEDLEALEEVNCKISMCPTSPGIDPSKISTFEYPTKIIIEFSKDFPNSYFIVDIGQHVKTNDIIGYVEEVKVKSKHNFVVDVVEPNYIVGTYEYDTSVFNFNLTEEEIQANTNDYINKLVDSNSDNSEYNELHKSLMDNMFFETYILNYMLYSRIPELALNYNENTGKGDKIDKCIEKYTEFVDDFKDSYNEKLKKVAGADNVKEKSSSGKLLTLKKEIDEVKSEMISEALNLYNTTPKNTDIRSRGKIEDFMLYTAYLDFILSDTFIYDEDNPYVVKLYDAITEFMSVRQRIELNEDNIDSLIKKFNEYCSENISNIWGNRSKDFYAELAAIFKYDYYKVGDDILQALENDNDKMSRYNKVYNYLLSLANLPADKKQEISIGDNDDVSKMLDGLSSQEASFDKEKVKTQTTLKKISIYFNTLMQVNAKLKALDIKSFADDNDIDLNLIEKYSNNEDVLSYFKGEKNAFGALTRTYLSPYLETFINITKKEADKLKSIIDESISNYESNSSNDIFTIFNKIIEMPWPNSSMMYYDNVKGDFYLFSPCTGVQVPPRTEKELEDLENDVNNSDFVPSRTSDPEVAASYMWGETEYGIDKIQYWLKYCSIATLTHCMLPMYWSTGLVIPPVPYILLPVIYIPCFVLKYKAVITVFGIGLCGIMPMPMILFVNTGVLNASIIPPLNMIIGMLIDTTKQLTELQRPVINASIDPLINSLNQQINDLELENEALSFQQSELNKIKAPKAIEDIIIFARGNDNSTSACNITDAYPLSILGGSFDNISGLSINDSLEYLDKMSEGINKRFDEVKDDIRKNYEAGQEYIRQQEVTAMSSSSVSIGSFNDYTGGFPSRDIWFKFVKQSEGNVLVQWRTGNIVFNPGTTHKLSNVLRDESVPSSANGVAYDLPFGVHTDHVIRACGYYGREMESVGVKSSSEITWKFYRDALWGETKGGVKWAHIAYSSQTGKILTATDDFVNALLDSKYLAAMKNMWDNSAGVNQETQLARRMAACHWLGWFYGDGNLKRVVDWNHQAAKHALNAAIKTLQSVEVVI